MDEWARVEGTMLGSRFLSNMQREHPVLHGCRPHPLHVYWFEFGISTQLV